MGNEEPQESESITSMIQRYNEARARKSTAAAKSREESNLMEVIAGEIHKRIPGKDNVVFRDKESGDMYLVTSYDSSVEVEKIEEVD